MRVKRRRFLEASAAGLAALGWPQLVRGAAVAERQPSCPQDGEDDDSTSSCAVLVAAYRRAIAAQRPLLVLVIPEDLLKWRVRGEFLGALINSGDDAVLAALGMCEVVCARTAHAKALPVLGGFSGAEPLAFLVETGDAATRYRVVPAPAPDELGSAAAFDRELAEVSVSLRDCVGALPARAAHLRSPADVVRLAAQARTDVKDRRVPGSKWADNSGCGVRVEKLPGELGRDPMEGVLCGMGFAPPKARRMLYFYVDRRRT